MSESSKLSVVDELAESGDIGKTLGQPEGGACGSDRCPDSNLVYQKPNGNLGQRNISAPEPAYEEG
jgi:hypothetical protein